jgi:DNA-binding response OmpR family regulator
MKRIVLLEDNRESRAGLAALLRSDGHEVVEVKNALEAQAWIASSPTPPDVAIIDIDLPGLRGDQWALYLKETSPETRIIFVSGLHGLAGIDRYGPDARYFHKPFAIDELMDAVNEEASELSQVAVSGT